MVVRPAKHDYYRCQRHPDWGIEYIPIRPQIDGRSHRALHDQGPDLFEDGDAEIDVPDPLVGDGQDRGEDVQLLVRQHLERSRQAAVVENVAEFPVGRKRLVRVEVESFLQDVERPREDTRGRLDSVIGKEDVRKPWVKDILTQLDGLPI